MVLLSGAQLVNRNVIKIVINYNVIKISGNFEGVIIPSGSTIVNGGRQVDFTGGSDHSYSNSTKKDDQFVVVRGVVEITIEVTYIEIKRGFDEAVANFLDFFTKLGNYLLYVIYPVLSNDILESCKGGFITRQGIQYTQ